MFYLMKMSHSLYTVASELISLSSVSVRGKRRRQECFQGGSQNIITLKKKKGEGGINCSYIFSETLDFKSLALLEGDFPPLVMIMFILYYLLHSNCITKVIQNLIRAALKIKEVSQ